MPAIENVPIPPRRRSERDASLEATPWRGYLFTSRQSSASEVA
jgi:hypothetical protein